MEMLLPLPMLVLPLLMYQLVLILPVAASDGGGFAAWARLHGRAYGDAALEARARANFAATERRIAEHNSQGLSWRMGHTPFSDLSDGEFEARLGGSKRGRGRAVASATTPVAAAAAPAPAAIDWVSAGKVTPIKDECTY